MTVTPLAHCKAATCRHPINVNDVYKEKIVEESPSHLVVEYKCSGCGRKDRMVGTIESWEQFKRDQAEGERGEIVSSDQIIKAAQIEVDAIDGADDLITLWRSYRTAPLIEAVLGSCNCDDCKKRREA